jgi:hypothetical protein
VPDNLCIEIHAVSDTPFYSYVVDNKMEMSYQISRLTFRPNSHRIIHLYCAGIRLKAQIWNLSTRNIEAIYPSTNTLIYQFLERVGFSKYKSKTAPSNMNRWYSSGNNRMFSIFIYFFWNPSLFLYVCLLKKIIKKKNILLRGTYWHEVIPSLFQSLVCCFPGLAVGYVAW